MAEREQRRAPRAATATTVARPSVAQADVEGEGPRPAGKRRGPKAGSESARRGGLAVKEKYGQDFFSQIGAKGGRSVRERHGAEFYTSIGRLGGTTTREHLGREHYERIGRMGGLRQRKREEAGREAERQAR